MQVSSKKPVAVTQEALGTIQELDRALAFHYQWLKAIHRSLICDEPARADDLAEDAHCRCKFGQWYYGLPQSIKTVEPEFATLEAPHRAMHAAARRLLQDHGRQAPIPPQAYEGFMELAMTFKDVVRNFQLRLINQVCTVDHLTGAWNRYAMSIRLTEEAERARRLGQPCALSLLDLDHFKDVNDTHGHGAGDLVLQSVVRLITQHMRPYDSLFRYGGEEFLICLPNTRLGEAEAILNRIRENLAATPVGIGAEVEVHPSASFGVAALDPGEAVEVSIERADHALLAAKAGGRNRVRVWDVSP